MSTVGADNVEPSVGGTPTPLYGGVAKVTAQISADGLTLSGDINVTSVTDSGAGDATSNLTNAFSSVGGMVCFGGLSSIPNNGNGNESDCAIDNASVSSIRSVSYYCGNTATVTYNDYLKHVNAFGDLA